MERRTILELRADQAGRKLVGYAAKFGSEARIGRFTEMIAKGAFAHMHDSGHDIKALVDHDPTKLLARKSSGNLKLSEDEKGLAFEIALPQTTAANDVLELARRGELGGMSIGFMPAPGGEHWQGNKRTLTAIDLHEISVVTGERPAYGDTTVSPRTSTPRLNIAARYLETVEWDS